MPNNYLEDAIKKRDYEYVNENSDWIIDCTLDKDEFENQLIEYALTFREYTDKELKVMGLLMVNEMIDEVSAKIHFNLKSLMPIRNITEFYILKEDNGDYYFHVEYIRLMKITKHENLKVIPSAPIDRVGIDLNIKSLVREVRLRKLLG